MNGIVTELPCHISNLINPLFLDFYKMGITHIGHGIIRKNITPTAVYSNLEWARKYKNEAFYKDDPLRQYALKAPFRLISWDHLSLINVIEKHILEERKRICSAKKGVLLSFQNNQDKETFVLGTDSNKLKITDLLIDNKLNLRDLMEKVSDYHRMYYN